MDGNTVGRRHRHFFGRTGLELGENVVMPGQTAKRGCGNAGGRPALATQE